MAEPGTGSALPGDKEGTQFGTLLNQFRQTAGISTPGNYYAQFTHDGQASDNGGGERSLDVGVIASAAPNSLIGLYAGASQDSTTFVAYQNAIWDPNHNVNIVSSSWTDDMQPAPDSPFLAAYWELFIDAALRNISVFTANGDGGSSGEIANGLTNLSTTVTSPYGILVGGTSLSTPLSAQNDPTIQGILQQAQQGNEDIIWRLVAGGMTVLPDVTLSTTFLEAVWNQYYLLGAHMSPSYQENNSGRGGVDPTQETPWYQTAFGLDPVTTDPLAQHGRGAPDVSALSYANMVYLTPKGDMKGLTDEGGTSAATPFWAALTAQLNAIFVNQNLPQLGYMNDLLYIAAAVAPASFNDVTYGNNTSSFTDGGGLVSEGVSINATGFGYQAGTGYDLATGLGTPNGLLLARALTAIAHSQMYFPDAPDLIDATGGSSWASGATQNLLFQPILSSAGDWSLSLGTSSVSFIGTAADTHAWTNQFAQQSLQVDFSSDLVTMFDRQSQGVVYQAVVAAGANVAVSIDGQGTAPPQAQLSSAFGFAGFVSDDGDNAVQVSRAVAIAETAGGGNDQDAVVRTRQNGINDISVLFYKVDDLSGTIAGIAPGQTGYDAATAVHAYQTIAGGSWIAGAGYGQYSQTEIVGVDAGDLIAMKLFNGTNTFYAFAQANEAVNGQGVGHLWNYGLNTWGWEDLYGGGDRDFNDLVIQLDFTSASGSGLLV
ncbi:DUF4114 domain-containing protein [Aquabacter sp. CN5-332]|uniref:DUF4114 domain-containing protein n=1 Tax=Aquabacter sp. CN5-332 TaxID=3156608 RepID=UPI0032B429A6